jgi:putative flippase GtrA
MSEYLTWEFLWKFLKFGAVGISGMAVDFGFTWLCKEIFKIQKYVSNAIGFTLAATSNYIFNRIWTFESKDPGIAVEYTKFIVVSVIGLGINTLVLWILHKRFGMGFYLAKLLAIGVTTIWNFLANYFFTFPQ